MSKVICKYCNVEFDIKNFARHIKSRHQKDYKEYIDENLDEFKKFGWNRCLYSGKIVKGKMEPKYFGFHIGNIHRGVPKGPMLEETKRKLSEGRKGDKHWNYGKTMGPMSDATKYKISKANKGNPGLKGELNPAKRKEVREKISRTRIMRGVAKGKNNPMWGKTHTPEAIKKIFSHKKMNKLEKMVADELDRLGYEYKFQFFINKDGVCKSYDFKLKGIPLIIEVDGDFWHGNPNTKSHFIGKEKVQRNDVLKEKIAKSRGYHIIRLWESDIKNDISVISKSLNIYKHERN